MGRVAAYIAAFLFTASAQAAYNPQTDSIIFNGATSGSLTMKAPAVAGTNTVTLPAATGTAALVLSGTSGSIGGSALTAGVCATTPVTITGATAGMAAIATPVTYPGDSFYWRAYVSSSSTVTVTICAAVNGTPTASTYNIRVIQ